MGLPARVLRSVRVLAAATGRRAREVAVGIPWSVRPFLSALHVGWWGATLLIAAAAAFGTWVGLGPQPEKTAAGLVPVAVPDGWRKLPVAAQLRDAHVTKRDSGCAEGFGSIHYEGNLGPFTVAWSEWLYKGLNAGETGWGIDLPGSVGSCRASERGPGGAPHPHALRVDEAQHLYVLESYNGAVGACRRDAVVTARANEPDPIFRTVASALAALLIAGVSYRLRPSKA